MATSRSHSTSSAAIRSSPCSPGAARTSRWTRFLATLSSGTCWKNSRGPCPSGSSMADLAGRLRVTPRPVRRDVERLRTLGYPVHASHGVGGGYRLGPGQDLPPLLLDDEEAIATAVSLLAGAGGGVASAGDAALRALTQLHP